MTYPVSTVPSVLAYLKTTLRTVFNTDATPDSIYLCVGEPGEQAPTDIVVISGVVRTVPHFAMVGDGESLAQEEMYKVLFKISTVARGASQEDISSVAVARAWQLLAYVETAVRTDPSLGGLVLSAWPGQSTGGTPFWAADLNGMACEIESTIDVESVF